MSNVATDTATENLRGAAFMMVAMLGFGIEDALFKAATASGGISPGAGTLMFGGIAMLVCAVIARTRGVAIWTRDFLGPHLLVRTGFELMGRLFFALALAYTPLSTTSAILQAAPLFVMLGAALFLGERIGPRRWAAMAVGLLGVMLIVRPTAEAFDASALFALLGMLGFAGRDLATRAAPARVHSLQMNVLGFAVVALAGVVILVSEQAPPRLPTAGALALILGTAIAGVIGYSAMTQAMRTGAVGVVAPFRYFRLLVALILAYVVFGERPDQWMLIGALLVVGAGVYSMLRERHASA